MTTGSNISRTSFPYFSPFFLSANFHLLPPIPWLLCNFTVRCLCARGRVLLLQLHHGLAISLLIRRNGQGSLEQYCGLSYPNFVSPKRLLVPLCVKTNGATPPGFKPNLVTQFEISNSNLSEAATTKKYAKLHDFCLGIPYGGLLFVMGLLGFIIFRSPISLVLGVIPGFSTVALSVLGMRIWRNRKSNLIFILGQAVIAGLLAWQYSQAYILTRKILPWGFYAFLSGAMVCFYSYVMLSGGNPPPKIR